METARSRSLDLEIATTTSRSECCQTCRRQLFSCAFSPRLTNSLSLTLPKFQQKRDLQLAKVLRVPGAPHRYCTCLLGAKIIARLVKDRLDRELIGNVSIQVLPTERSDAWEVQGRGELAPAILVEQMRCEDVVTNLMNRSNRSLSISTGLS
jgi:hypothetical protein